MLGERLTLKEMKEADHSIPLDLLHCAKGLIFLTVIKAGLVVSGRVGTGLLIARLDDDEPHQRWSSPCAIGTVGMGWGLLGGADVTHYLVVLTRHEAVEAMLSGTVQLGTELGIAVGPVGRSSQVSTSADHAQWTVHPAYSYAHSQGFFIGVSLEGSILSTRHDVNAKFYGKSGLSGDQVLDLPPPKAAEPLYEALDRALAAAIPEDGFRPSKLFQDKETAGRHVNPAAAESDVVVVHSSGLNPM
jgi:lipid-binding SYLF domain-containing protein